jgi:ABC-2 type transport system ATP-binding protein
MQMRPVEVSQITKSFGNTKAVNDVSFAVERGEILGLLGPNGAGKTTTIRMVLDIFRPDTGTVSVFGGPMTEEKKDRIGYMPEERGLYQDLPVERCLVYLGTLKGLSTAEARQRVGTYLKQFDLAAHKSKKVKELSKGMQQKAQLINTILHQPELIIVDEPFAALDPVNTQMVKDLLIELRQKGTSIVLCTHQMHHAEELCDRIVLIDHGRIVLEGGLEEVRRQYAGNAVLVRVAGDLPDVPGVQSAAPYNHSTKWTLTEGTTPQDVLRALVAGNAVVEQFEIALPSLEEVFIKAVGRGGE